MRFETPRDVRLVRGGETFELEPIFVGVTSHGHPIFECLGEPFLPGDTQLVGSAPPGAVIRFLGPVAKARR